MCRTTDAGAAADGAAGGRKDVVEVTVRFEETVYVNSSTARSMI
jgi:hypothetical protein